MNVNRRELIYTVSMLVFIAVVVFLLNIAILSSAWPVTLFRGKSQIKAVSIFQASKPHYLTSVQKKELLALLNESLPLTKERPAASPSSFQKISLHLFEEASIDITPLGTVNNKMALLIHDGDKESMIIEKEPGQIQNIINRAFEE